MFFRCHDPREKKLAEILRKKRKKNIFLSTQQVARGTEKRFSFNLGSEREAKSRVRSKS